MANEFVIKKGHSSNLFDSDGNCLLTNLVENGWYLTVDTAEVYVALKQTDGTLQLKKINDCDFESFDDLKTTIEEKATIEFLSNKDMLPLVGQCNIVYYIEDQQRSCAWNGTNYVWSAPEATDYTDIDRIYGGTASDTL